MITRQLFFKYFHTKSPLNSHSFHNAHQLFDRMPQPNFPSLHHSMLDLLHQNRPFQALNMFNKQIYEAGVAHIDEVSTALAVKACRGDPKLGSQIHAFALTSGLDSFLSVSNSLMHMYSKSGQLDRALVIFNKLSNPDTVSWNTLLSGFKDNSDALSFACRMNRIGVTFDAVTYTTALAHCADCEEFMFGTQLHSLVLKNGMQGEGFIANALVTLYAKWERIADAEKVFDEMPSRDLVSWNAILSGYSQEGSYEVEAFTTFVEMVRLGLKLDHVSFTSAVSACGHARNLRLGKQIHGFAIKKGYGTHESVCNVLISTYSKCDHVEDAKLVFDGMVNRNVVSCTTMISISEEHAVSLFNDMRMYDVYPNEVTFVGLIHAICANNAVKEGETVHALCIKSSFFEELVVANSFITMYAKFESINDAIKVFHEIENKVIITWNALISGFTQNKMFQEALKTFSSTIMESKPNEYTFGSVLSAIASSESISLRYGQWCHSYLFKLGLDKNPIVSGALLDMYAKRGSITESCKVFDEIKNKNQVAWTAIISAHSRHGDYESVMKLYDDITNQSFEPDSITFLSVLTACGRKGMVEKGKEVFESMIKLHKIEPTPEHYSCMVDMYGRAGRLNEAEEFLTRIPGRVGLPVLQSLLGSCKVHGNMEMGKRVSDALLKMEPKESGSYVLMSNLYAERADWDEVARIRKGMRENNVKKVVGFSWVDVHNVNESTHAFSSDDTSHPRTDEIYRMVRFLGSEMKSVKTDDVIEQVQVL
ncbi:putative tetratricopeptide-like helical domain superfamily [Helianthus annuus]|uniref:Putative pentatricopeptide repeat (PPR) superfamily protein n=1 Tax=Helianthus annuus TaxID=4232 RepID=A0A251SZN3_HELAN|nr:pentatricopeptide repeat-containing protein At4g32430, mitochondrial [Helianthus annuus]KAF5776400.1 putative tetratricopeptide-like helical domain superfamily [Helianthus annuus]KAJ0503934.1 putative tetratricopeptide-like helical domain superfamily [Helianthus annuus]